MLVVGVTGSLASGKTEVTRFFKAAGARVFDADCSAREAIKKGKPIYRAIVKMFGKEYLGKNGQIDRAKLAERVFNHPRDLKKLNTLIHPEVILDALKVIEKSKNKKGLLVLDVPLLFESKMENLANVIVVAAASKASSLRRAVQKGIPACLAEKILAAQWPLRRKIARADFVIWNNGNLAHLEKQVNSIKQEIENGY
jgi:dephospho-CoA kinase